jgi:hypothetical protein
VFVDLQDLLDVTYIHHRAGRNIPGSGDGGEPLRGTYYR